MSASSYNNLGNTHITVGNVDVVAIEFLEKALTIYIGYLWRRPSAHENCSERAIVRAKIVQRGIVRAKKAKAESSNTQGSNTQGSLQAECVIS